MSHLSVRPLNPQVQAAASEQLHEVPERIGVDIEALRTWIRQQPHLRARDDDQFLLSFLRGCKFSLEKAKAKIDKFYTLRTKYPELFTINDVDDEKVRKLINSGILVILPIPLNEHGPRIAFTRSGVYSVDEFAVEDISRTMEAIQEILLVDDDYAMVYGVVNIVDQKLATVGHFMQMTPSIMKKMIVFWEEALPLRIKGLHFINIGSGFEAFFNLLKPMLPKKHQKKLSVHGNNLDKLYEHIPQKYLPKEYGGENGSIEKNIAEMHKKLDEYRNYFKTNLQYGTDEKLRTGKPIDVGNLFGLEGSFRKLEVD